MKYGLHKEFRENLIIRIALLQSYTGSKLIELCNFPLSLRQFVSACVFFEVASHRTSRSNSHHSALFLEDSSFKCTLANGRS
jgi:hypothetical protein